MSDTEDFLEKPKTYVKTPARDEAIKRMREARKKKLEERQHVKQQTLLSPVIPEKAEEIKPLKVSKKEQKLIDEDKKRMLELAKAEEEKAKAEAEAKAKAEAEAKAKAEAEAKVKVDEIIKKKKPVKKIIKYVTDDEEDETTEEEEEIIYKKKPKKSVKNKQIIKYISSDEEEEEEKPQEYKRVYNKRNIQNKHVEPVKLISRLRFL